MKIGRKDKHRGIHIRRALMVVIGRRQQRVDQMPIQLVIPYHGQGIVIVRLIETFSGWYDWTNYVPARASLS